MTNDVLKRAKQIKLMIFDVDGVLTDGSLFYTVDGETLKRFHVHDGLGIRLLQGTGIKTAIITARQSPIVLRRANDLGISIVKQGAHDKFAAFKELLSETGITAEECGFIGDDWIDLPVLTKVGFAASVGNGRPEVTSRVHYTAKALGGNGAVREICDYIMRAQGTHDDALASFIA